MTVPEVLRSAFREDVPLSKLTTWKVGGLAKWVVEPTREQLPALFEWLKSAELPYVFLGRGSNVLAPDDGFPGVVILTRNCLKSVSKIGDKLYAESGAFLPTLSKAAANAGAAGFEFLIGIPGTVGGALVMNAGLSAFRPREIAVIANEVEYYDKDFNLCHEQYANLHPSYRCSDFQTNGAFIVAATFKLERFEDPETIHKITLEHLRDRKAKQPLDKPTAGSTFKQPQGGRPAAWYIEMAGMKGCQIGGARVSPKHANWIENLGGATALDIRRLICQIKQRVEDKFGVSLHEEVHYLNSNHTSA